MLNESLYSLPIVLASASPRRYEILQKLGFQPRIAPAGIDESAIRHADAAKQTLLLADAKALVVAESGNLTIAADTIVVLDGRVLEKPLTQSEAYTMLSSLSGRDHVVLTGVSVVFPRGDKANFIESTRVFFSALSEETIHEYIATDAPYDKAGGYGVQDAFGMASIHRIEGCYFNVMGFPASRFMTFLSEHQKFLC